MDTYIILLIVGVLSAIVQIVTTKHKLEKEDKSTGKTKTTRSGIVFYVVTASLAVLPAIQQRIQDKSETAKETVRNKEQVVKDSFAKVSYDSSLLVMKGKFDTSTYILKAKYDTTTQIISETLGKYGYKLDSANRSLVSLKDSARLPRTIINNGADPTFQLSTYPEIPGVEVLEVQPDGFTKIALSFASRDAGSSDFQLKFTFLIIDGDDIYFPKPLKEEFIDRSFVLAKNDVTRIYNFLPLKSSDTFIRFWIRGTYKNLDGSKTFPMNIMYQYNILGKTVTIVSGDSKRNTLDFINKIR